MAGTTAAAFGAGGADPYERALLDDARTLVLHDAHADGDTAPSHAIDVGRFLAAADATDEAAIHGAEGPLLDVGCGPGRMVRAAAARGQVAMGIDVSPVAIGLARRRGLSVLLRSVYEHVPGTGRWGTAILMDGNIGIGGDPAALLRRCAGLVRPGGGCVVIETDRDPSLDRVVRSLVVDDLGRRSLPFAWAAVGAVALRGYAASADLVLRREWTVGGRAFAAYERP